MIVELTVEEIDVSRLILHVTRPGNGAVCTFHGVVRDNADGRAVTKLYYEAYESMALQQMQSLVDDTVERWPVDDVALVQVLHRNEQFVEDFLHEVVGKPIRKPG